MTMFTMEGMIRAHARWLERGLCHPPSVVWHAYVRWMHTQGETVPDVPERALTGWLIERQVLHHRRAPRTSWLSAMRSGLHGTMEHPINDSKGCGGVMRVAPVLGGRANGSH